MVMTTAEEAVGIKPVRGETKTFSLKCGYMWNKIILRLFQCLFRMWNWNRIVSAAERVLKLFQSYLCDIEHVGKYSRTEIILQNTFEIISGKFLCAEIKLSQTDVVRGWNNFEIILFHM